MSNETMTYAVVAGVAIVSLVIGLTIGMVVGVVLGSRV
jgi:hypothetical protein